MFSKFWFGWEITPFNVACKHQWKKSHIKSSEEKITLSCLHTAVFEYLRWNVFLKVWKRNDIFTDQAKKFSAKLLCAIYAQGVTIHQQSRGIATYFAHHPSVGSTILFSAVYNTSDKKMEIYWSRDLFLKDLR